MTKPVAKIIYQGKEYPCKENETVLDAFIRYGVDVPFSCREGICQVCLLRHTSGTTSEKSQAGLRPTLIESGYFKACECKVKDTLTVEPAKEADLYSRAMVRGKQLLAPSILQLLIEPATPLFYHAGQFINIRSYRGQIRSYSIASVPNADYLVELHIKRIPEGRVSNWIFEELNVGDELDFQGPYGSNFYSSDNADAGILMLASGSGASPLLGIARDALNSGHSGNIHFYHGCRDAEDIYTRVALQELAAEYEHFSFVLSASGESSEAEDIRQGRAADIAFAAHPDLSDWKVYLAGNPEMVMGARDLAERAGANPLHIHIDPFINNSGDDDINRALAIRESERRKYPHPDPEIWAALKEGELLMAILQDFYTRVYDDPRLNPFFKDTTRQRAIEKQYNFLYQVFTGEKVYFGERPRNAHNWMVISDELLDYRENLMMETARKHGVTEAIVKRWRAIEEMYRSDIVKDKPWPKILFGKELPLDGYEDMVLEISSLCDGCQREVSEGEKVSYHVRLGTIFCDKCSAAATGAGEPG